MIPILFSIMDYPHRQPGLCEMNSRFKSITYYWRLVVSHFHVKNDTSGSKGMTKLEGNGADQFHKIIGGSIIPCSQVATGTIMKLLECFDNNYFGIINGTMWRVWGAEEDFLTCCSHPITLIIISHSLISHPHLILNEKKKKTETMS